MLTDIYIHNILKRLKAAIAVFVFGQFEALKGPNFPLRGGNTCTTYEIFFQFVRRACIAWRQYMHDVRIGKDFVMLVHFLSIRTSLILVIN